MKSLSAHLRFTVLRVPQLPWLPDARKAVAQLKKAKEKETETEEEKGKEKKENPLAVHLDLLLSSYIVDTALLDCYKIDDATTLKAEMRGVQEKWQEGGPSLLTPSCTTALSTLLDGLRPWEPRCASSP